MTLQLKNNFRSIRLKFFAIQFVSILLTVLLLSGISLSLLSEYYTASQQEKLQAHAQSFAIEIEQQLEFLKVSLKQVDTYQYHRYSRIPPLAKEFIAYSDIFPKLAYFDAAGEQQFKVVDRQSYEGSQTRLPEQASKELSAHPNQVILSTAESDPDLATPVIILSQKRIGYFGDEFEGIVQATVPVGQFAALVQKRLLSEGISLLVTNRAGYILLHPQQEKIFQSFFSGHEDWQSQIVSAEAEPIAFGQRIIESRESYYSYLHIGDSGWHAFAVAPISVFDQLLLKLVMANIYLAIFSLLIGILLAHLMVRPILINIRRIKQQTQNLASGKLDRQVIVESKDELFDLAGAVNTLTDKLRTTRAAFDAVDLMLQTVVNPLLICDPKGAIFKTNVAAQELFAVSAEDFSGQSLSRYFSQRSPLAARELLQDFLDQPQLKKYETEIQVAGGHVVPVKFSFAHAYGEAGEVRFVVCLFDDISQQKAAEAEIAKLAYFDSLTGLPNRSLLHDRLQMAIRHAERSQGEHNRFAVMFLDLDHFKVVNDTLGHSIGDRLLQGAAERLKGCLREADTISRVFAEEQGRYDGEEHVLARLGGDEFIILLPLLRSAEDAGVVAQMIIEDMAKPFALEGHEVVTPASVGLAIYPDDGTDSETLLRCADVAMYYAKEQGRNSFYFYSAEMNEAARERLRMEHLLRQDVENKKNFYLVYQPKVDFQSNEICGMEALVRWHHDELGEVSPQTFIPIAEDSGLIVPLGKWILETACRQLQCWIELTGLNYRMAVNLSGRQLKQPDLLSMIAGVLHDVGLDPGLLELELTESMLMETVDDTVTLLGQLTQLGTSLAIDDFGTGYSSLNYLKRFPIDTLKIDRSFVRDLEADEGDVAIVEAIIAMANSLKIDVVAEGVETEMQHEFLQARGAHQYQGFLFSRPLSAYEFENKYLR